MQKLILYFIQAGIDGPIKIGTTKNLVNRFESLQVGNHAILYVIGAVPVDKTAELETHIKFQKSWIRGEWFEGSKELLSYVAGLNKTITEAFNNCITQGCQNCGRPSYDKKQIEFGVFSSFCRRCTMQMDGRLDNFIKVAKKPKNKTSGINCSNCGQFTKPPRKGRCHTCYEYFRRNQVERKLTKEHHLCVNCDILPQKVKLRCRPCYAYFYRFGRERNPKYAIPGMKPE